MVVRVSPGDRCLILNDEMGRGGGELGIADWGIGVGENLGLRIWGWGEFWDWRLGSYDAISTMY